MLQKHDINILNSIYKNSRMAMDCTKQVQKNCHSKELNDYLSSQISHYADNCAAVRRKIRSEGGQVEKVPFMQKAMAEMGIKMKASGAGKSKIAELMYNGTNMGIIDVSRTMNHSLHASPETKNLANKLLDQEVKYADGLKKFL